MVEINLYVDGKTIAKIISEQMRDVRGLLREQREKERERAIMLSMVYDQIAREESSLNDQD